MSISRILFSASLILCCSAFLAAQVRIPLTDLPPGLTWSTPLDHTDGEVYALLTSDEEGTYLVRGDSAVWMSPLVYTELTSMGGELRLNPPLGDFSNTQRLDSLLSRDGSKLVGGDYSTPPYKRSAGGLVMRGKSFYLQNRDLIFGRRSNPETITPSRLDTPFPSYTVLPKLEHRACISVIGSPEFEFGNTYWNGNDGRITIAYETPKFDVAYANGHAGNSIFIVTQGLAGDAIESFSEVTGALVAVVVNGTSSTLVTTREIVEIDSLGREIFHAYLPSGYQPISAIGGNDGDIWLLDEGADGKGRISQVNNAFEFKESYAFLNSSVTLNRFARRKIGGEISVVGYNPDGYNLINIPLSNPLSVGLNTIVVPGQDMRKESYPLKDTLPLGIFSRQYFTNYCELSTSDTVLILQDSSVFFDIGGWTERRGRSGQWVCSWASDLTENPDRILPAGGFYIDTGGVRHTGRLGDPYILANRSSSRYKSLGQVAPGYALIEEETDLPTINVMNIQYFVYDSIGRRFINLPVYRETNSSFLDVKQAGLLSFSEDTISSFLGEYNRRLDIDYVPWEILQQPLDKPSAGCQISKIVELTWPNLPDYSVNFSYNGDGRMSGRSNGLSYWIYVQDSLSVEETISSIDFNDICGYLIPGSVEITHDPDYPNVISFLDGIHTDRLEEVFSENRIEFRLIDTVSGCERKEFLYPIRQPFAISILDACFSESGGAVFTDTSPDTAFLDFSDGTFEEYRRNLPLGAYQMTFRSTSGCQMDTSFVIGEAQEILPALDSIFINGSYAMSASVLDTSYTYLFSWSNGDSGQNTTLSGDAEHELYTTQYTNGAFCRDTLTFRLGDGISGLQNPLASDLKFAIDSEGSLLVFGLDELSLKHNISQQDLQVQVHDASGRVLSSMQAFGEPMKIRRSSNQVVSPKFLSFGALGGVGIIW